MTAAGVLAVFCGVRCLALLFEVRLVDRRRADAVFGAGQEEQRRPRRVQVVHLRHRPRVEVREAGLEERARRARDVVALVDGVRLFSAERIGEAPVELLEREGASFFRFAGLPNAGQAALIVEYGSLRTPLGAPVPSATVAAPRPRSANSCVNSPPKEWPMMIGGRSRPR